MGVYLDSYPIVIFFFFFNLFMTITLSVPEAAATPDTIQFKLVVVDVSTRVTFSLIALMYLFLRVKIIEISYFEHFNRLVGFIID